MTALALNLDAIKARCVMVSEGPWEVDTNYPFSADMVGVFSPSRRDYPIKFDRDDLPYSWDAEFIAHARTDVPALVAEVERLQSVIDRAKEFGKADPHASILERLAGCLNVLSGFEEPSDSSSTGGEQ